MTLRGLENTPYAVENSEENHTSYRSIRVAYGYPIGYEK
jgi:hypothetical protein